MAVCESQLQSGLARLNREGSDDTSQERTMPAALPLTVDYRSPVSHFVPPAVELYAARHLQEQVSSAEGSESGAPAKRKRGRPRVDKTSPEYLAGLAARKQAREMAAVSRAADTPPGAKRKRGRPRVDKTSPEYLARKRQRELEALERKAKREYKRRTTARAESGASSSTGDGTPRVKRKYTKRTPSAKKNDAGGAERVKGKRGRPRKDANNAATQPQIRVRNNLMPPNNEPISLDSDEEPDPGCAGGAADSLSLDENLRALRHIHEKYANIHQDDLYEAHLLAAKFSKPPRDARPDDDVLSVRSSEGGASVQELDTRVEKLEDSSNSDSDTTTSGSGSSSSGSSSSSSSCSSESSDTSDSESEADGQITNNHHAGPDRVYPLAGGGVLEPSAGAGAGADSDSDSDPERAAAAVAAAAVPAGARPDHDDISESENESPDKSFQCHICKKWYSTRVTLKIHRRSHQNRGGGGGGGRSRQRSSTRYECDICNETFPRREKLYAHRSAAHRGELPFRCEVCRRCFEQDEELAVHLHSHTHDERNGRCDVCGSVFPRYEQLRRHRATAHAHHAPPPRAEPAPSSSSLPHACAHCGKRFSHVHSLTRHLHNHAKQLYRCVVCKASFARADQLAQHLNSHLANYKRLKP